MKKKFRYTPPGVSIQSNAGILVIAAFVFMIIISPIIAGYAKEALWYRDDVKLMDYLRGAFVSFWAYAAVCIAIAVRNYHSFRSLSQSIYTMKRAGSPAEIHRMCLTVPVIGLLAGLALAIIIMLIYRGSYMDEFSVGKLPEYNRLDIWRALTW